MEIEDYKPNSHKYREAVARGEQPEAKKIVQGNTTSKKISTGRKIKNEFFKTDIHDIMDYVIFDVGIPKTLQLIGELIHGAVDMTFGTDSRKLNSSGSRLSYTRFYDERRDERRPISYGDRSRRDVYDYNEISFDSKGDAIDVLNELIAEINEYGSTNVGRFYKMAGQPTMSTDFNYGWTTLRGADVVRNRDGSYSIDLPRAIPI